MPAALNCAMRLRLRIRQQLQVSAAGKRRLKRERLTLTDELGYSQESKLAGFDGRQPDVRRRHSLRHQVRIDVFDGTGEVGRCLSANVDFPEPFGPATT